MRLGHAREVRTRVVSVDDNGTGVSVRLLDGSDQVKRGVRASQLKRNELPPPAPGGGVLSGLAVCPLSGTPTHEAGAGAPDAWRGRLATRSPP